VLQSYTELDWRIRMTLTLIVLGFATFLWAAEIPTRAIFGLYALGFVMLMFAFPSRGEKNPWGDW